MAIFFTTPKWIFYSLFIYTIIQSQNFDWSSQNYKWFFGDLHTHTSYSDGNGTPWEAFEHAKNSGEADYMAVSDHDRGNYDQPMWYVSDEEWDSTVSGATTYTDDKFLSIPAYEYTSDYGWGHINTFNIYIIKTEFPKVTGYFGWIAGEGAAIAQFNHADSDDFEQFSNYDKTVDERMTMLEITGGSRENMYQQALDSGWHIAPTNNSDTHQKNWITGYDQRTVVLAESLTLESFYDAMKNRRLYASEDKNFKLDFNINGRIMGELLDNPRDLTMTINFEDPDTSDQNDVIDKVEIIKSGGEVEAEKIFTSHSGYWEFKTTTGSPYYYLRITNREGKKTWSAPIWTRGGEPLPVSAQKVSSLIPSEVTDIILMDVKGNILEKMTKYNFDKISKNEFPLNIYFVVGKNNGKVLFTKKIFF